MSQKFRKWTDEDVEILRELWGNESIDTISKKLKRSINAIKIKASKLNLGSMKSNNLLDITISDISKLFDVGRSTILGRWQKQGLEITKKYVSEKSFYYCVDQEKLLKFLKNNQNIWDSKKLERFALGTEPKWLVEKRKSDYESFVPEITTWTKEELEIAKKMITGNYTAEEIAIFLQKSKKGTLQKLRKLGYAYSSKVYWREWELTYLTENCEKITLAEMAKELRRTERAVANKIRRMGLKYTPQKQWTQKEIDYLKLNYGKMSKKLICENINRSIKAVNNKVRELGISIVIWNEEEVKYLMENYDKLPISEIANYLQKSTNTIVRKAKKMGISFSKSWKTEEIEYLMVNYGKISTAMMAKHLNRSAAAIGIKARSLGLFAESKKWSETELNYLIEHYGKKTSREIGIHLGRTRDAVIKKAGEVGLKYMKRKPWSKEEEQYLLELSDVCCIDEIAKILNRTPNSIRKKLEKLAVDSKVIHSQLTLKKSNS